jgi:hypothetical protein
LVSEIPAGDRKTDNLFYSVAAGPSHSVAPVPLSSLGLSSFGLAASPSSRVGPFSSPVEEVPSVASSPQSRRHVPPCHSILPSGKEVPDLHQHLLVLADLLPAPPCSSSKGHANTCLRAATTSFPSTL